MLRRSRCRCEVSPCYLLIIKRYLLMLSCSRSETPDQHRCGNRLWLALPPEPLCNRMLNSLRQRKYLFSYSYYLHVILHWDRVIVFTTSATTTTTKPQMNKTFLFRSDEIINRLFMSVRATDGYEYSCSLSTLTRFCEL